MAKLRKKHHIEIDVLEAATERIRYVFDIFDKVVVSFSGGKDSTAVLAIAREIAKEKNALPLEVWFFDEEAIHPPTIEYVERIAAQDDIDMKWFCLEFEHRNACSVKEPFWYTWDKEKKDKWVRPLPESAITSHPRFYKGLAFQDFSSHIPDRSEGQVAMLTGMRTEESLRRFRTVATKVEDNYITRLGQTALVHPIYDMNSTDVWRLVEIKNLDYNRTYDIFNKTKLFNKLLAQRVCPPFGEQPLRGLWVYAQCFPEMWHKMLDRVDGVATAWRYANTALYGTGAAVLEKPAKLTYKKWLPEIVDAYSGDPNKELRKTLTSLLNSHYNLTEDDIPETNPHPLSGMSWAFLCKLSFKGDFKGRLQDSLVNLKHIAQKDLGISEEETHKIYGRKT